MRKPTSEEEAHLDECYEQLCSTVAEIQGADTFMFLATTHDSDNHSIFMRGRTSDLATLILEAFFHITEENPLLCAFLTRQMVSHSEEMLSNREDFLPTKKEERVLN